MAPTLREQLAQVDQDIADAERDYARAYDAGDVATADWALDELGELDKLRDQLARAIRGPVVPEHPAHLMGIF